jgi:hypothetical protein
MYALIRAKRARGDYDPSHDVWQHIDPAKVIEASDFSRIRRVHIKGTRNRMDAAAIHWGRLYPMQAVDAKLAKKAGVPQPACEWDATTTIPSCPASAAATAWTGSPSSRR